MNPRFSITGLLCIWNEVEIPFLHADANDQLFDTYPKVFPLKGEWAEIPLDFMGNLFHNEPRWMVSRLGSITA